MLCSAVTSKGTTCTKSHHSGNTVEVDGWVHYLCAQHFGMIDKVELVKDTTRGHAPVVAVAEAQFKVMVTGHRTQSFNQEDLGNMAPLLDRLFTKLKDQNTNLVAISGGADGADRAFARAAVRNNVPFDLYLPHKGYGEHYFKQAAWFTAMCGASRNVVYSSTAPKFNWSMNFKRNIDMIQVSDLHVVISNSAILELLNSTRGGTSHAVKQMKQRGIVKIIHINPRRNTVSWVNL